MVTQWVHEDATQRPSWPSVKVTHAERRIRRNLLTGFLMRRTCKKLVVPFVDSWGAEPANRERDLINKLM
jgi:hypothetical protein